MKPLFVCLFLTALSEMFIGTSSQQVWLEECKNEEDCNNYINATCVDGYCRCNEVYVCETKILVNKIGGNCNNDRICNANNSECNSLNVCACQKGFVPSEDLRRCVRAVTGVFGKGCENNADCVAGLGEGSHCLNTICKCKEDYYFSDNTRKCRKDKVVGDICERSEECHQPTQQENRLMCIMGECKCKLEYTDENGYCIENNGTPSLTTKLQNVKFYLLIVVFIFL